MIKLVTFRSYRDGLVCGRHWRCGFANREPAYQGTEERRRLPS